MAGASRRWAASALLWSLAVGACAEDGGYRVLVHVPGGPARAARVEVSLLRSCGEVLAEGDPQENAIRLVTVTVEGASPLGAVAAGSYGLYGRAWDSRCRLYSAGCDTIRVEAGGTGVIDLFLAEIAHQDCEPGHECSAGFCVSGDAGRDAGLDADTDAWPDGGPDAASDGGVSCDLETVEFIAAVAVPEFSVQDVAASGSSAVLALGDEFGRAPGVALVDLSEPTEPIILGTAELAGNGRGATGVSVSGDLALVAEHDTGLHIVDLSNPSEPRPISVVDTPGAALDVAVSGNLALVADEGPGLQIVDYALPEEPFIAGSLSTPSCALGVAVSGDLALVAADYAGLLVVRFADPSAPVILGSVATSDRANDVAVSGRLAVVAIGESGVELVDFSDPTGPLVVGRWESPNSALGVAVSGNLAFVADRGAFLQVLDISDPLTPLEAGRADALESGEGVAVSGDLALLAVRQAGLQVARLICAP